MALVDLRDDIFDIFITWKAYWFYLTLSRFRRNIFISGEMTSVQFITIWIFHLFDKFSAQTTKASNTTFVKDKFDDN